MTENDSDVVARWVEDLDGIGEAEVRRRLAAEPGGPDDAFDLFQKGRPNPLRRFVLAWCKAKDDARARLEDGRREKAFELAESATARADAAAAAARYADRRAGAALAVAILSVLIALLGAAWPHLEALIGR
jgi:hypothetical protein